VIRVRGREGPHLVDRPARIGPQHERLAIRRRCADVRFGTDDAESLSLQAKASNDGRIDRRGVRQRRTAESPAPDRRSWRSLPRVPCVRGRASSGPLSRGTRRRSSRCAPRR
jgi:hypothetical protein